MTAAKKIMMRIKALAKISDEPGKITRTFASPAMRRANELVGKWMRAAGMETRIDVIGNLIGHYDGEKSDAKIFLLGSHLDTVRRDPCHRVHGKFASSKKTAAICRQSHRFCR